MVASKEWTKNLLKGLYEGGYMSKANGGYDYYSEDEIVVGRWIDGRPIYRISNFHEDSYPSDALTIVNDFSNKNKAKSLVPTLTNNTGVSCSSQYSGYEAYKVFDGNDNSYYCSATTASNPEWITYTFDRKFMINSIYIVGKIADSAFVDNIKIYGIDDDNNETLIHTINNVNKAEYTLDVKIDKEYLSTKFKKIKLLFNRGAGWLRVHTIKILGGECAFSSILEYTKITDAPNSFNPTTPTPPSTDQEYTNDEIDTLLDSIFEEE